MSSYNIQLLGGIYSRGGLLLYFIGDQLSALKNGPGLNLSRIQWLISRNAERYFSTDENGDNPQTSPLAIPVKEDLRQRGRSRSPL